MRYSFMQSVVRNLAVGAMCLSVPCWALEVGKPAPQLEVMLLNHKHFSLEQEKGHLVIITFWASWCPYCLEELPILNRYYVKHKKEGLRVLAVSIDDPEDEAEAKRVMRAYSIPAALAKDTHYTEYGRIYRTPTHFIIDRTGILLKNGNQGRPLVFDKQTLDKVITPMLRSRNKKVS